jgi:uncharacterized protein YidB (DUF937 family)
MGLLDALTGSPTAPGGQQGRDAGSISPIIIALLGVLAPKVLGGSPDQSNANLKPTGANSGGFGDILNGLSGMLSGQKTSTREAPGALPAGGLGSMFAGAGSMASIFSNGLGDLLKQFQQSGQQEVIQSWIGKGPNQPISPAQFEKVLGQDHIKALIAHSGLSRDELLASLSKDLPNVIDQLTPHGRLPSGQELSRKA